MRRGSVIRRFFVHLIIAIVVVAIAQWFWLRLGLDASGEDVQSLHDWAIVAAYVAPFITAPLGNIARPLGTLAIWFVAGAVLTTPFAIAHVVGS